MGAANALVPALCRSWNTMDDEGDAPTLLTDEHVRLLGLPGDTQDSLAESTIGAATQGEIRRKVLAQLVDRSCSDDVVAAACQVLGLLGRSGLQAEEESFHETVEALMEVLRRDSASAEVKAFRIECPDPGPKI